VAVGELGKSASKFVVGGELNWLGEGELTKSSLKEHVGLFGVLLSKVSCRLPRVVTCEGVKREVMGFSSRLTRGAFSSNAAK
jgi:hypothetical protein